MRWIFQAHRKAKGVAIPDWLEGGKNKDFLMGDRLGYNTR